MFTSAPTARQVAGRRGRGTRAPGKVPRRARDLKACDNAPEICKLLGHEPNHSHGIRPRSRCNADRAARHHQLRRRAPGRLDGTIQGHEPSRPHLRSMPSVCEGSVHRPRSGTSRASGDITKLRTIATTPATTIKTIAAAAVLADVDQGEDFQLADQLTAIVTRAATSSPVWSSSTSPPPVRTSGDPPWLWRRLGARRGDGVRGPEAAAPASALRSVDARRRGAGG